MGRYFHKGSVILVFTINNLFHIGEMLLPMHVLDMSLYIAGQDILLADCPLSPRPKEDGHPGRSRQSLFSTSVFRYGSRPEQGTISMMI